MTDAPRSDPEVTVLLQRLSRGDREAMDALVPRVYDELRAIARSHMRGEDTDHTLQTTALVHEAYLRLVDVTRVEWRDRSHFFAMASRMMRRILIEHARGLRREKRGGGRSAVTLDDHHALVETHADDLLALDEALTRLEALDERRCRVVECRFFAGLQIQEIAEALDVSPGTVRRDWRLARAWLNRELASAGDEEE